jgi:hypothetical protein
MEDKHPVNADHSSIVKFNNVSDLTYRDVCCHLEDYLKEMYSPPQAQLPLPQQILPHPSPLNSFKNIDSVATGWDWTTYSPGYPMCNQSSGNRGLPPLIGIL